ncbi:MAG: cyclic nucleotide-binding domain-containing protein [Anaerolineales bacterium]
MISPEVLRRYPFFSFLNEAQLQALAMLGEEVTYPPETVVFESGQAANALYLSLEGTFSYYFVVVSEHDPYYRKEYYLCDINPGEIFGISALVEPYIYTATMRAEKLSRALRFDAVALRALCAVDVHLSCAFMRALARVAMERLQMTRTQLIAARQGG